MRLIVVHPLCAARRSSTTEHRYCNWNTLNFSYSDEKSVHFSLNYSNKGLQRTVSEGGLSDRENIAQVKVPDRMYEATYYMLEPDAHPWYVWGYVANRSVGAKPTTHETRGLGAADLASASNSHRRSLYARPSQCLTRSCNQPIRLQLQSLRDRTNRLISTCTHPYLASIEDRMLTISVQVRIHPQRCIGHNETVRARFLIWHWTLILMICL